MLLLGTYQSKTRQCSTSNNVIVCCLVLVSANAPMRQLRMVRVVLEVVNTYGIFTSIEVNLGLPPLSWRGGSNGGKGNFN